GANLVRVCDVLTRRTRLVDHLATRRYDALADRLAAVIGAIAVVPRAPPVTITPMVPWADLHVYAARAGVQINLSRRWHRHGKRGSSRCGEKQMSHRCLLSSHGQRITGDEVSQKCRRLQGELVPRRMLSPRLDEIPIRRCACFLPNDQAGEWC